MLCHVIMTLHPPFEEVGWITLGFLSLLAMYYQSSTSGRIRLPLASQHYPHPYVNSDQENHSSIAFHDLFDLSISLGMFSVRGLLEHTVCWKISVHVRVLNIPRSRTKWSSKGCLWEYSRWISHYFKQYRRSWNGGKANLRCVQILQKQYYEYVSDVADGH